MDPLPSLIEAKTLFLQQKTLPLPQALNIIHQAHGKII